MAEAAAKRPDMYAWEGIDRTGKRVRGEMSAPSEAFVRSGLRRQGINPSRIKRKSRPLFGTRGGRVSPKDIAVFSRQLATMISAGIPLVQAFEIIGRGNANRGMQDLVLEVKSDVEAGGRLAAALGRHPEHFSALFVNLVAAGEHAGVLEDILNKVAIYLEKTEALKSRVRSALFYPTAVIVVAFVITSILLVYVIPQFEDLFKGFGADLPALTLMVIALSKWFQANWYLLVGGIVLGIVGLVQARRRSRRVAEFLDRLLLRLPVIGDILHKSAVARFARTLSTMFAAGTPLVEAMVSVAGATGNIVYQDAVMKMRDEVATGTQLQATMRQAALFPGMVVQMVAIGEESGSLDTMLGKVADWYEQEVDDAVASLTSLLEPIIMVVLGLVIGGLVVAMYLPIFKMGQVV